MPLFLSFLVFRGFLYVSRALWMWKMGKQISIEGFFYNLKNEKNSWKIQHFDRFFPFFFCEEAIFPNSEALFLILSNKRFYFSKILIKTKFVSFIPFFVFGFWSLGNEVTKIQKYCVIFVYILQGKMSKTEKNWKENHAIKVTKIPKTKRRKYGMNETIVSIFQLVI